MDRPASVGIRIEGGSDCLIDNCVFDGPGTGVEIGNGDRIQVSRSKFSRRTKTAIRVKGGTDHRFIDNIFGRRLPPQKDGLAIIRQALSLDQRIPDREILASLHAVLDEREDEGKRKAARSSSLGKWLIEHGSDINNSRQYARDIGSGRGRLVQVEPDVSIHSRALGTASG